jgi:hypothetical protein
MADGAGRVTAPRWMTSSILAFGTAWTTTSLMSSTRATARITFAVLACAGEFAGLFGCGSDEPARSGISTSPIYGDGQTSNPGPRVLLGSGREAFEAIETDGSVPLISGIQGGFHVWTSFLAYGFDTDVVRMELATRWTARDDSLLEMKGNVAIRPALDPSGTPALVSLGWPASIFDPACADGQRLDVTLTVRDMASGISASDAQRWIVAVAEEHRSTECAP